MSTNRMPVVCIVGRTMGKVCTRTPVSTTKGVSICETFKPEYATRIVEACNNYERVCAERDELIEVLREFSEQSAFCTDERFKEFIREADAVATDALYHELLSDPDLLQKLRDWAPREFEQAVRAAAEGIYAAEVDQ